MTTIDRGGEVVTQINVITVEPENQDKLVELMSQQVEEVMSQQPGFISINLHKSLDGTRVVNYVQWESQELLDRAHETPEFLDHFERYKGYLLDAGPRIYEVVHAKEVG